jgi:2-phospho-L-lactate guanylyltransferase
VDALWVSAVLAVTTDAQLAAQLKALGASCLPDEAPGDLNHTLREAVAAARRQWPELRPAAVVADMPALLSVDLDDVLSRVDSPEAFVPDAAGHGTTVYVGTYERFLPRFGPRSRDAHLMAGAHAMFDAPLSVRRDVDDLEDLGSAVSLGVGDYTASVLQLAAVAAGS